MMNPMALMKIKNAMTTFQNNHPKFVQFFQVVLAGGTVTEGTIIEITVTKPGEEPITTNMKVQASDVELFNSLKDLNM